MLYMLGQIVFDIRTLSPKHLIKVGVSRNVSRRMCCYRSDNPSAIHISTTAGVEPQENACHSFLSAHGKHYSGEWWEVSEEFFLNCLKEGFTPFPKKDKKQNVYNYIHEEEFNKIHNYYFNNKTEGQSSVFIIRRSTSNFDKSQILFSKNFRQLSKMTTP